MLNVKTIATATVLVNQHLLVPVLPTAVSVQMASTLLCSVPIVYLFIDGKLVRWNRVDEFTLDNFLDFLSSDNYIEQSTVVSDKLSKWIKGKLEWNNRQAALPMVVAD